jgi:hypothetical protein
MSQSDLARYFAAFFFFAFAAASRSVFLRRATRFLTLSLPWLFPKTPQHSPLLSQFQAVSQRPLFVSHSLGMKYLGHVYHPKAICFLAAETLPTKYRCNPECAAQPSDFPFEKQELAVLDSSSDLDGR